MTGYILFRHAVLRVFRNLDDALAVSGLIWIGITALLVILEAFILPASGETQLLSGNALLVILLANLLVVGASVWIAVAWHRFALLDMRPNSVIPKFDLSLVAAYFGRSIVIGLLVVLFGTMVMGILVPLLSAVVPADTLPLAAVMIIGIPASYAFYRVSPVLPAAALGEPMRLSDAWLMTMEHKRTIFQVAVLSILATLVLQVPSLLMGSGIVGLVYGLATGWITLMVGVSLLSSIYELCKGDRA